MSRIDGYVIITRDGRLKKPRHSAPSFFLSRAIAQNNARNEGDSVVPAHVDLSVEPVFIRSKTVRST
jgi:hypothetical protein